MTAMAQSRPATPDGDVIVFDGVSKLFPRADALQDVSVAITRGQVIGLLGPNGSGKSTFLKLIAGLYRPTRGTVRVEGAIPGRDTKRRVAYMPEVDHVYPWMTVAESLRFVAAFFPDWDQAKADRLVDFLELPRQSRVGKLSKGMRGRLRLVLVLARRAAVILLDEPLSGIDPPSRLRIVEALVGEFEAGQQTIVLSTHEVLETESLFDRIIFLNRGRVALEGDVDDLRARYGASVQDLFKEVLP